MVALNSIEFFNLPNGDVVFYGKDHKSNVLQLSDRDIIQNMIDILKERYSKAYDKLCQLYDRRKLNVPYYQFSIVKRFIRCNFGQLDEMSIDIDRTGHFQFEEVNCPLRGECECEGIVCKCKENTNLSDREKEIFRLIVEGLEARQIADQLGLAVPTINNHRENIKRKIGVRSIPQMIKYWQKQGWT